MTRDVIVAVAGIGVLVVLVVLLLLHNRLTYRAERSALDREFGHYKRLARSAKDWR